MRRDKKSEKGRAMFVLPASIGRMKAISGKYAIPVDEGLVKSVLGGLK
jgi:3-dehydroquinate synthetase